ncbi:hypothetical protein OBBRIDRAFT_742103, partial [Obba rivulosa]
QHRVCPRFSIQAQVKALCFLHSLPFNRTLVNQFSIAFDVYLDILHGVDQLVNAALHRDRPNWRMLNACPPCLHSLEDEPPLKYRLLVTMDGNSSLKLVNNVFRSGQVQEDIKTRRSDIWILPEEVDRFKDEVSRAQVS